MMVSNDTKEKRRMLLTDGTIARVESELEVKAYIQNLIYTLDHGARIEFQSRRMIDQKRDKCFTNQYTMQTLFQDEDPVVVLERELRSLKVEDYIRTVKDIRFKKRSEMREFGKVYNQKDDVYIKIRVEVLGTIGQDTVFVMSFHFAERELKSEIFPYKKN